MYKNNYDQSSTGINIEVRAYYDNWLSRDWFEESISKYELNYNTTLYCYNTEPESIKDFIELDSNINRKQLIDLAEELSEWHYYGDYTDEELREEILDANPAMILNRYWDSEIGNSLHLKPEFTLYHTHGYCQGDIETVLYKGDSMSASIQNSIDNLFWDSPVRAGVRIDEEEYEYFDYDLEPYQWQKEKFIDKIMNRYNGKNPDYVREQLNNMLPNELDYVG